MGAKHSNPNRKLLSPTVQNSAGPIAVHVAPALHPVLATSIKQWREHDLHLVFANEESMAGDTPGAVLLEPAFTPAQAAGIRAVADEHPLALLIGVVRDSTGLQTHTAISAGAAYVVNLQMPWDLILGALAPAIVAVRLPAPRSSPEARTKLLRSVSFAELAPEDAEIVRLLRQNGLSVRDIADRLYTSERSMYRRLRRIYTQFGVTNRRELEHAISGLLQSDDSAHDGRLP